MEPGAGPFVEQRLRYDDPNKRAAEEQCPVRVTERAPDRRRPYLDEPPSPLVPPLSRLDIFVHRVNVKNDDKKNFNANFLKHRLSRQRQAQLTRQLLISVPLASCIK